MKSYDVYLIDPPWPKKKGGLRSVRPMQGREMDYNTMSFDDIFTLLDLNILPSRNDACCHAVFIWNIDASLIVCEENMLRRGYKRHCRFIWDKKNGVAPCFTIRYSHEYLVWYYKPKMLPINPKMRGKYTTVFCEQAREHSRKPDCAYRMIESIYQGASCRMGSVWRPERIF